MAKRGLGKGLGALFGEEVTLEENVAVREEKPSAAEKKEKEKKLDRAVDSIRGKFGFDTISRGAIFRANFQVGKKYRAQMDKDRNEDP